MSDDTPTSKNRSHRPAAEDPEAGAPAAGETAPAPADDSFAAAEAAAAREAQAETGVPGATSVPGGEAVRLADRSDAPPRRVERAGIREVTAGSVEVRTSGIGAVHAEEVFVQWGGVGAARADRVGVEFGSVGAALAGEVTVTQGFAGSIVAREATVEQAIARTVIAQNVSFSRPSAVLVLIAAKVEGEVRPLLDWRGALAAGAAIGIVSAVVAALRQRRSGRS